MNKKSVIGSSMILTTIIGIVSIYIGNTYAVENVSESGSYNTLVDTIIGLAPEEVGWEAGAEGLYQDENGDYRYIGGSPDNWIKFNDDMYRIIGIFQENTHGLEGYRVKLIRVKPIGAYAYGVYLKNNSTRYHGVDLVGINDGDQSTPLNSYILLNEYFYNATDVSEDYGKCEDWAYVTTSKTKNCDTIIGYGIKNEYRSYIENTATWHYNWCYTDLSKQALYQCERLSVNIDYSTQMPVGVMYASDYAYASGYLASSDAVNQALRAGSNWLYIGYEWTITPNCWFQTLFVNPGGMISSCDFNLGSEHSMPIRPTFYLKPDVKVTGGTGAYDDPYTISM